MRFTSRIQNASLLGVATLLSGTVAAQAITLATMPILTRLFAPEVFGFAAAAAAIGAYLGLGSTLRLESAVFSTVNRRRVEQIVATALWVNLLVGIIAAASIALFLQTTWSHEMKYRWGLLLVPLIMVGYGAWAALRAWAIRDGAFGDVSRASVTRACVYAAARVLAGVTGAGAIGLLVAEALQYAAGARRLFRGSSLLSFTRRLAAVPRRLRATLTRYRRFWQRELPSQLLDGGGSAMLIPSFAIVFGAAAAGIFSIADRLLSLPISQISNAMGDVFVREMGEAVRRGDQKEAKRLFRLYALRLTQIGIPLFSFAALTAPFLLGYVFGAAWTASGYVVALLAPAALAGFVVSPLSRAAIVLRRQELIGIYGVANLVLTVAAFAAAYALTTDYLVGVAMVSGARVAAYLFYFLLLRRLIRSTSAPITGE